jgi:DNA-binding IclR family transcriptional regulator
LGSEIDLPRKWPMRVLRAGVRRSLSRSATRALDVLELFGEVRRPLRAVEIARRFELHPSTVNQLLKTMVESAHLSFEAGTKTYLPSPRLTRFGSWLAETYGGDGRLRALVTELRERCAEVITLSTPNDLFMQVIDHAGADLSQTDRYGQAERGLRVSMFGSAIGLAYLSTLPATEVRRLADRARIPPTELGGLLAMLEAVRVDGFANGPSAEGSFWSIAIPLNAGSIGVPLVLGLAGPTERVRTRLPELAGMMRSTILRYVVV